MAEDWQAEPGGITSGTWLMVVLSALLWLFCVGCLLLLASGTHDAIRPLIVVPAGAALLTWSAATEWREDRRHG